MEKCDVTWRVPGCQHSPRALGYLLSVADRLHVHGPEELLEVTGVTILHTRHVSHPELFIANQDGGLAEQVHVYAVIPVDVRQNDRVDV